jgi:sporulation protein YlmC with PRC-barrel domain
MKKSAFIVLALTSVMGMTPLASSAFADDFKERKTMKPATLVYPSIPSRTDAGALIGRGVEDISGNKVGEIEGIHIDKDGKVADVVVGVGGFLGVGERDVLVKWSNLRIIKDTEAVGQVDKIVVTATKEQLKSMAAYRFGRPDQRRTVFEGSM